MSDSQSKQLYEVDTPALIINETTMRRNLLRVQTIADKAGITLRPHIKTHKIPELARLQLSLGACGIAVAKLSEAECMAAHGLDDIQIANQIVGETKIRRMLALSQSVRLTCAVDSAEHVTEIGSIFSGAGQSMRLLIEIDSGLKRCGLTDMNEIISLSRHIIESEGVDLAGVMTHAGHAYGADDETALARIGAEEGKTIVSAANAIRESGIACQTVSAGSTPTARHVATVPGLTELRVGNYIFNDVMQVALGSACLDDCALTVISTVISSQIGRIVIDAGSKSLSAERGAHGKEITDGYGYIQKQNLWVSRLSEEHGILDSPSVDLSVGNRVEIIPAHACAVMNLFDRAYLLDDNGNLRPLDIAARGKVS